MQNGDKSIWSPLRNLLLAAVAVVGLGSIVATGGGDDDAVAPTEPTQPTTEEYFATSGFASDNLLGVMLFLQESVTAAFEASGSPDLLAGTWLTGMFCDSGQVQVTWNDNDQSGDVSQGDTIVFDYDVGDPCQTSDDGNGDTFTQSGTVTFTMDTTPTDQGATVTIDVAITTSEAGGGELTAMGTVTIDLVLDQAADTGDFTIMNVGDLTLTENGLTVTISEIDFAGSLDEQGTETDADDVLTLSDGDDADDRAMVKTSTQTGRLQVDITTPLMFTGSEIPSQGALVIRHEDSEPVYCIHVEVTGGDPANPSIALNVDTGCDGTVDETHTGTWQGLIDDADTLTGGS